jgi:hypothetical protein
MLIDGQDDSGLGWTYVVRASALIAIPQRGFNLKHGLELGSIEMASLDADLTESCA